MTGEVLEPWMKILVDQQEKKPLPFMPGGNISEVVVKHLPFGDYWCEFESGEPMPIVFERKSFADMVGTLSNRVAIDRHKEKARKASERGWKLYCIIEGSLTEMQEGRSYNRADLTPIVKSIFTFKVKYGMEPVFCNDREEMMAYMINSWEAFGRAFKCGRVQNAGNKLITE